MEKQLGKDEGVTRHDLGREEFLQRVWEWHGKYGTRINEQMRRLGSSLDWQYVGLFLQEECPCSSTTSNTTLCQQECCLYHGRASFNGGHRGLCAPA